MSTFTDVFGNSTLPPAEFGYAAFTLTTDTTFVWPYNTDGNGFTIAKVMDVSCASGNSFILPDSTQVSTGEDFLIRNTGSNTLLVKNAGGTQIASVAIGAASYFYLTDNSTSSGVYGVIGYGVGTSTADAASLVGYGIKAVGASLNQSHPAFPTNTGITVTEDHRAKLIVFTGGSGTFNLTSASVLGDDFFTMLRNDGTGTFTIDPAASELVDGMSAMQVQPGESLILICTGTQWYSVGYGRSTLYQFTQLTKDVSAGGTITLSASEAANKLMTFIGNPTGAVNVVIPSIVAVYYTQSSISTSQTITLKTAAGSGVGISQGARIIALCDGTNVVSAQSAVANTSVSLTDGSAAVPSLFFATQTNTGLYKSGTQDLGVTVNGSTITVFGSTGPQMSTVGPNSSQRHTVPAVTSDTFTLNAAAQTLSNKTFGDNPVFSGGTTNGVTYLNGSKVLTSGSAFTFDGSNLYVKSGSIATAALTLAGSDNSGGQLEFGNVNGYKIQGGNSYSALNFYTNNVVRMALSTTGLSITGTLGVSGQITSTVATGTAPLVIASTTKVANLNVDLLDGADWASPLAIGSTTPAAGAFTTLSATGGITFGGDGSSVSGYLPSGGAFRLNNLTGAGAFYLDGANWVFRDPSNAYAARASISPTGLSVTGSLSASGNIALTNAGTNQSQVYLGDVDGRAVVLRNPTPALPAYLGTVTNHDLVLGYGTGLAEKARVHSGGLSVTGAVSASDTLSISKAVTGLFTAGGFYNSNNAGGSDAVGVAFGVNSSNQYLRIYANNNSAAAFYDTVLAAPHNFRVAGTTIGTFSSTGLSVTGSLNTYGNSELVTLKYAADGGSALIAWKNSAGTTLWDMGGGVVSSQDELVIRRQGSAVAKFDASGNLGLGVTPSAWNSGFKALELSSGSLFVQSGVIGTVSNAFLDSGGSWIYKTSSAANLYRTSSGQFQWFTSPSGTAGNPITFTQAMTLDASGNLNINQTTPGYANANGISLQPVNTGAYAVINHASGSSSGNFYVAFGYNGSGIGSITQNGTTAVSYNTSSDYRLKNITGPITNSGAYIDSLRPVEGTWKADGSPFVGLVAHEVQEVSRTQIATGEKDGEQMQAMDYSASEIIANLIAEVQALRKRVAILEEK